MNYKEIDSTGKCPEQPGMPALGSRWRHPNGNIYTVSNFTWFGDDDRWLILLTRPDCEVPFTRSIDDFFGEKDGVLRFVEVVE